MPNGVVKLAFGVVLFALSWIGAPTSAQADNLIMNPGFEDWNGTSFNNWIESGDWGQSTLIVHSGVSAVVLGPSSGQVKSNQLNIAGLTPGMYEFGVWFRLFYEGTPSYDFAHVNADIVADGGSELYQSFDDPVLVWTQMNGGYYTNWFLLSGTFNLTASSGALELVIALLNNDNSAYSLAYADDAYLRPVPEPATLALLGVGLIGVGVTLRRRRR